MQEFSLHNQPFFSVIIPCHNCRKWIKRTLDSVASQDFKNYELIVVDDGSTDASLSVIKHWVGEHPEIDSLIKIQRNLLLGAARNTGIRAASANFIAFLDADDIWARCKLSKCYEKLQKFPEIDVVCHNEWLVKDGIRLRQVVAGPYSNYEDLLFRGNVLSSSATVVRKDWLEKVNGFTEKPDLFGVEDYDLWLRLAKEGAKISFINEPLGEYIVHGESMTVAKSAMMNENELHLLESHYAGWPNPTRWHKQVMKRVRANSGLLLAKTMANEGDCLKAWRLWYSLFKQNLFYKTVWSSFVFLLIRNLRLKIHN